MENVELARYEAPTAIQQYTIPYIVQGHDVVAVAQTGMDFSSPQRTAKLTDGLQVPARPLPISSRSYPV